MPQITVIRKNILELTCFDAIVCPANLKLKSDGLLGRKTLNSRIHDIGGRQLDEECKELVKAPWITMETGCAVVSKAYNMGFRHIIHAVAPDPADDGEDEFLLSKCWCSILEEAMNFHIRTIAIPVINNKNIFLSGENAAHAAISTVRAFLNDYPDAFDSIAFVTDENDDAENKALADVYDALLNDVADEKKKITFELEILDINEDFLIEKLTKLLSPVKKRIDPKIETIVQKARPKIVPKFVYKKATKKLPEFFDRLITKKLVLGVVVKKMLQKNSRWLMKLMNRLGINISDEVLNAVIRDNIKDIRMKARDDRSFVYVDLRNISVIDIYDRLHSYISTSPYFIGFDSGNKAESDEEKKKAVETAVKFINDQKIIQKIIDDIVSSEDKTNKAADLLGNLKITAGEIRYK